MKFFSKNDGKKFSAKKFAKEDRLVYIANPRYFQDIENEQFVILLQMDKEEIKEAANNGYINDPSLTEDELNQLKENGIASMAFKTTADMSHVFDQKSFIGLDCINIYYNEMLYNCGLPEWVTGIKNKEKAIAKFKERWRELLFKSNSDVFKEFVQGSANMTGDKNVPVFESKLSDKEYQKLLDEYKERHN